MRVLILTYGTRGDVQPYVALGVGLRRAGHEVMLATSTRFRTFVLEHDLQFGPMTDDMLAILDTDQGREMIDTMTNVFQVLKRMLGMLRQLGPLQRVMLEECWTAARAFAPDAIVFHPKTYGGSHIAERLGVPALLALPFPIFVPTGERPVMGFPDLKLGSRYNRTTYRFVHALMRLSSGKHVRAWRAGHELPRTRVDMLHASDGRPLPVLHAYSEHVVPRPSDWPPTAHVTGYWFLDEPPAWESPAILEDFLARGPAPVYVGFGSMAGRHPDRMARIVVDAMQQAGVRGIIAKGWGGLHAEHLPDTILPIDDAPHAWLFPRMATVVHHGGAGTTAAGLRAGVPSVIVPFIGDQPFWGKRVSELGVGSRPIPRRTLTSERLAQAIRAAQTDDVKSAAASLGRRIRADHGIQAAISCIESVRATC